jgi:hypothetical protein
VAVVAFIIFMCNWVILAIIINMVGVTITAFMLIIVNVVVLAILVHLEYC